MKVLIFTDSRGQHKPSGSTHEVFPYKLAKDKRLTVELYLCPFKWTTSLDFLATFDQKALSAYDLVILYTGIVDWSPRPYNNAVHDVYDSCIESNADNLKLNTENYNQKILNNKKLIFDEVFGEANMKTHFSKPFDVLYEDSQTINMYSLNMAEDYLLPRLLEIHNLLFINANRFVNEWDGDYWKKRPGNIYLTHDYAQLFSWTIPRDKIIDLLEWTDEEVKVFTCDNLHLSEMGSEYLYERIIQHINRKLGRCAISHASENKKPLLKPPRLESDSLLKVLTEDELSLCKRTTLIVGVRLTDKDEIRVNNLEFLLKWLIKFYSKLFDILVVEQDEKPRFKEIFFDIPNFIRYQFIYNPHEYNRGWGYNVAVNHHCQYSDVVVLMDTDVLTGDGFVESILACHREYVAVSPYRNIYYSNEEEVEQLRVSFDYSSFSRFEGIKNPVTITGGIVAIKKSAFLEVNGFEQYIGYGCEDRALDVTILNRFGEEKTMIVDEVYLHLHHEPDKSARKKFAEIYDHLTTNYGCSYDPAIGPLGYIHKNCRHASKWLTNILSEKRSRSFGDLNLYCNEISTLTANGMVNMIESEYELANQPLLPLLHRALADNQHEKAYRYYQLGLNRYQNTKFLSEIFESKLSEIGRWNRNIRGKYEPSDLNLGDTLVILGNGPSLKDIMCDPQHLEVLRRCHTFGLNAAYRAYERFDFYPTYFGSFDYEVNESHKAAYENLVLNCDRIKKFFFAKNRIFSDHVREHPRFQKINFIPAPMGVSKQTHMSSSFENFLDIGSSGTNAVQAGFVLGYRKFILLGCDCKYVEILDGIEVRNEVRYLLTKDLDSNPNYWFDDYQRAGDKFNKPNTDSIQYVAWQKLKELEITDRVFISNGSYPTALKLFDRVPFGIYTKKYENIFLVMSCDKNRERINTVRKQYQKNLSEKDLLLFVVGGSDHDAINHDAMLTLNCGDLYENLPSKVYGAIRYCTRNLKFKRIVKVDDDIFINFDNFYKVVDSEFNHSYYGRRNPPVAGTRLNPRYHYGRVSASHKFHDNEFPLPQGIQWNSGGMYILNNLAAEAVSFYGDVEWIDSHLYEDVMIFTILKASGIVPVHHENERDASLAWMIPSIEGVLANDLQSICPEFRAENVVSIHCGADKTHNLSNAEIWKAFRLLSELQRRDLANKQHEDEEFYLTGGFFADKKIILSRAFNRPISFYVNKVVFNNGHVELIKSEAGQIVRKAYLHQTWIDLVSEFSGNVTVFIPDFDISFLPHSSEASELPNYLDLKPGLTFLVRARNEVENIEFLFLSLKELLNDHMLNCELVFVDNNSIDDTYQRVASIVTEHGIHNVSLLKYNVNISSSGEEHSKLPDNNEVYRSLDTYYNWCLEQANCYNVIKWDADFLAITDSLRRMIVEFNLPSTDNKLAIWCSGKTLFKHGNEFYLNNETMYNEFRVFSKAKGYRWEYAPRWEICSKEYMVASHKEIFVPCVFLELKDLGRNEFEFRSQGTAITSDIRDSRDHQIIAILKEAYNSAEHNGLTRLDFDPLRYPFDKISAIQKVEATNEELDAMQSYWLNVYSRPKSPLRFNHKGNAVIQGLWVGEQISNFHRLCIESFLKNGHCFILYTYGPVKNLPAGVVIKDANKIVPATLIYQYDGSYAGFSDLFRNKLLYSQGGWYVDLDIFCLRPFDIDQEILFSLDHYHVDTIKVKRDTKEIVQDKYYVQTNPCKLPAGHEIAQGMYSFIFKKIVFDKLKSIWLGDNPDAPESWLQAEVASSFVVSKLNKFLVSDDFERFVGSFGKMPPKLSFYQLLEVYDMSLKDVGQKTWGEIGPIMITREVVSRGLEKFATKPEMFQGIIKYFEIERFVDPEFNYLHELEKANPYSLDLFYTMWRRKGLLDKFDISEPCLLRYLRGLVSDSVVTS